MTHTRAPFCTALFVAASLLSCLPLFAQPAPRHIGRVNDSSYHHLLVSGGPTQQNLAIAARESRALLRLSEHNLGLLANFGMADLVPAMPRPASAAGSKPLDGQPLAKMTDAGRKVDWAVGLGTGPLAPNTFPAKYSLNVNATPDCINDYVVYGTNVKGKTGGQANVIGINNLYSGSNPTGFCGTTPTIDFAYNGSTASGTVLTSPQLSMDGTKIVYVESASGSSIFHILTWKAGDGSSATNSVAPTKSGSCVTGGNCLVSLTYSSTATTTFASPWVDYTSDKAYVASDDGTVYRLSCAFLCALNTTPTIDWTYSLPVAGTGGPKATPSGPVYDPVTGNLIVSDQLGEVWSLKDSDSGPSLNGVVMVGGGGCTTANPPGRTGTGNKCTASGLSYGVPDSPLVDISTAKIYAVSGNNGVTGASAVIVQMDELLTNPVTVNLGVGSAGNTTSNADLHDGAFDNDYINGSHSHGHLFTCGTDTAVTYPDHYWIGFANYPTMDSGIQGKLVREYSFGVPCSPYTEFWNPNVNLNGVKGEHDILVSSLIGGSHINSGTGWIVTDDITQGTVTGVNAVNYPGGTSGVIADNVSTEAQASSFYFGTLGPSSQGTCATTNCAVKLTQTSLQ
jgi:hypothetical protein